MRLLESFFRAQTFNPYVPPMELVFEKTTAGNFTYTIPANARHVKVEFAGGNGGQTWWWDVPYGAGGRGERVAVLGDIIGELAGKTITGTVGASTNSSTGTGGSGAPAGGNGTHSTPGGSSSYGGGGGGATKVIIDGTEYIASGGGGATTNDYYGGWYHSVGGAGGGPKGGAAGAVINDRVITNGNNATGNDINETNNGYVRVYINAQSDLLFEKVTPGGFNFTIPNTASTIIIEIAAGNGADGSGYGYSGGGDIFRSGGRGAVKVITLGTANGQTITGMIGQSGGVTGVPYQGGTPNGNNGQVHSSSSPLSYSYGGGGGGNSYCSIMGNTYIVSGGAGGAAMFSSAGWSQGGAGGGPNAGQPVTNGNGGNATDGDKLNTETTGYIRIYKL